MCFFISPVCDNYDPQVAEWNIVKQLFNSIFSYYYSDEYIKFKLM